jgi:Spy/CpxP family protein refolding chaperone
MNKRWLVIVLFASLAFNLAVMLMFAYISIYHRPPFHSMNPKPRMEQWEHKFEYHHRITPKPEDMLTNKDEIKKLKDDFRQKRREFMETLRQENFSEEDAYKAMEVSRQAQDILEKRLGNSLIEFRKKLTPREAKEYFKPREDRKNQAPGTERPVPVESNP